MNGLTDIYRIFTGYYKLPEVYESELEKGETRNEKQKSDDITSLSLIFLWRKSPEILSAVMSDDVRMCISESRKGNIYKEMGQTNKLQS